MGASQDRRKSERRVCSSIEAEAYDTAGVLTCSPPELVQCGLNFHLMTLGGDRRPGGVTKKALETLFPSPFPWSFIKYN